jgi:hypothetical protein
MSFRLAVSKAFVPSQKVFEFCRLVLRRFQAARSYSDVLVLFFQL